MNKPISALVLALGAGLAASIATAAEPPAEATTIIYAGQLLATAGQPPLSRQTVVVRGDRIAEVRPDFVPLAAFGPNARLIDLRSQFVMAGLTEAHYHLVGGDSDNRRTSTEPERMARLTLSAAHQARAMLAVGITSIRDVGDKSNAISFQLRDAIADGRAEGPRIFASGRLISRTEGHGAERREALNFLIPVEDLGGCDGVESCRRKVRENIGDGHGADLIKFTGSGSASDPSGERGAPPTSFDDEVATVVNTAASLGRTVAVHAHSPAAINQALKAGAFTIEHGTYFDAESVALFKAHRAYLVPTSFVGDLMLSDPRIKARNTPEDWKRIQVVGVDQRANAGRAYKGGIALGVGTDGGPGSDPRNTIREIEIFVDDGIPAAEALKAATVNNAAIVGHAQDLGQVRPGFHADIVAMPKNPLEGVTALRGIDFVMKDGVVYTQAVAQ